MPSIEDKARDWQRHAGFQPFFWDAAEGRIWLQISDWDREFLFSYGLATGLGSNPVGLDRGQLGDQFVCQFQRVGKKVLLLAQNLDYRAVSDNPVEQRTVRESFAESILWGGEVAAETGQEVLVDVTGLLNSDIHGVVQRLKQSNQGDFVLDASRCAVYLDRCQAFPENTELESSLTFSAANPGSLVAQVTPSASNLTLRQHLSFVQLPDDDYQPRGHHPRCASMYIDFSDYAAPIAEPLQKRWILRHRLKKANPAAALSPALEPIVYYVDPGAPELIRDALMEGASWWNQAFEAAGFENAFQVRVLPDTADPMDVRYNVIQWVHRSTRGWSYGGSVIDPRTGEIIKGHVTLGSLRVRQDRLMFDAWKVAGLAPALPGGNGLAHCGMPGVSEEATLARMAGQLDPVQVALARIRQLSAHEVGHTLGFVHNFAASTYGDRASVMDYPAPRVKLTADGLLDLSDAYGVGIGGWDQWSVRYAYSQFAEGENETAGLAELVLSANEAGMVFVSDADSRPAGAAHPRGNLWDNGTDSVAELGHVMQVRRVALQNLKPELLRPTDPLSDLEHLLVPVYLHHRYQVEATAKLIGGVEYTYDLAGLRKPLVRVPADKQRQAFQALLQTLSIRELQIPDHLKPYLVPAPFGSFRDIERFSGLTDPMFDRESCARVAADLTIGNLLQPQRVSRLAMDAETATAFGAQTLVLGLVDYIWQQPANSMQSGNLSQVLKQSVTDHLLKLAVDPNASIAARTAAGMGIQRVKQYLGSGSGFAAELAAQIKRFEARPYPELGLPSPLPVPPGSPIGSPGRLR